MSIPSADALATPSTSAGLRAPADREGSSAGVPADPGPRSEPTGDAPPPGRLLAKLRLETAAVWGELVQHRGVLFSMWRNQTRARYAASAAGAMWAVVSPLALIAVYTVVFSALVRTRLPGIPELPGGYGFFVFAGTLPWLLVSQTASQAPSSLLEHGSTLRRFLIPPTLVPASVVLMALTDTAVAALLFAVVLLVSGLFAPLELLALVPATVLLVLAAYGLALGVSALNLYGRDVAHAVTAFLPFWFFASPIAYPARALPAWAEPILRANPLTGFIDLFRWALLAGPLPGAFDLVWSAAVALAVAAAGIHVFQETRQDFVDLL